MSPVKVVKAVPMAMLVVAALLSSSTLAMAQAGSLDTSFGAGGIVQTPNTSDGRGMAIQRDGKIVVAGGADRNPAFALARYNTDGSLDAAFGNGGIAAFPTSNGGPASGVAIQTDGKIVTAAATDLSFFVFRLNADGTLDQNFGSAGRVRVGFAVPGAIAGPIAVQPDGNILVATNVLTRLLPNGQLDPNFGTDGTAALLGGQSLTVLGNGKLLAVGGGATQYNADGSLDLSFGVAGQTPALGRPSALVPLSNGQFVLVGTLASGQPSLGALIPEGFVIVRYNSDGTIDTTFGTHGAVVTSFRGNNFSEAFDAAVQPDGAIVAAGFTAVQNCVCAGQASDFALARYTPDGQLNAAFGTNGLVITSFNGDNASISALAIQSDGKIVALGRDRPNSIGSPNPGFTLVRYLSE